MKLMVLNFSHPLTNEQIAQLAARIGEEPEEQLIPTHIDRALPIADVARDLADAVGLDSHLWQTTPLLINPPALTPLALALIAELHGRIGGFPAVLNIRPVKGSMPARHEVGEVINLQALREAARGRR